MQINTEDIHYIYKENQNFIDGKNYELVNKKEILFNLDKHLKKNNVIDGDFIFVSVIVFIIWLFIGLIALAPILELMSMISTILDDRVFLEEYSPIYLTYSVIIFLVVSVAGYWFIRPLLDVTKSLMMYPVRHSSAEKLYDYMIEVNSINQGIICSVIHNGDNYIIQYSYMRKNQNITSSYLIHHDLKIKKNDKIYIIAINKFDFPL